MARFASVMMMVIGVVAGVFLLNLFIFVNTPSGETEQAMTVERGTPLDQLIHDLESKGVISNIPLFKSYLLLMRASSRVRAGEYLFPPRLKPRQVLALLMKGDFATRRVTIPEGWTAREIAAALDATGLVNVEAFLLKCSDPELIGSLGLNVTSLEGYLFPDTYEFYKPKNETEILKKFVGRFKEVYTKEFEARAQAVGFSQNQVVTLASIVEKETGRSEERPLIASVLLNRLKKEMPLAVDPTVIYGIPNFSGNLTRADLERPTPYNTYLKTGLPPTPIANPGLESIKAVLYPAETSYLFFVSRKDGTHQFSATEAEHIAAVRRYQLGRP